MVIMIHFAVDAIAVILSQYNVPAMSIEGVIGVMTALAAVLAKKIWTMSKDLSSGVKSKAEENL